MQSQDAAKIRDNFFEVFSRHGLFVTGIVLARSRRASSSQVHDIPCHVMDCYKKRKPSEAATKQARGDGNEIYAGLNRSDREAYAAFVNFIDSNFSPRNHISKLRKCIRSQIISTVIRFKSHIMNSYSAKFTQYLHESLRSDW